MKWNPFSRADAKARSTAEASATPPASYAQWSQHLDALARGDDDDNCLRQLHAGSLHWSAGVAPLFVQRLADEVQRRLNVCADRLQRDLQQRAMRGGQEPMVVRAIVQARAQLAFIHRLCLLPALPEGTRQQLAGEVRKFAERSQQSLETTARADRSGQLETLLRNNPLTRYDQPEAVQAPQPSQHTQASPAAPRKRNILL